MRPATKEELQEMREIFRQQKPLCTICHRPHLDADEVERRTNSGARASGRAAIALSEYAHWKHDRENPPEYVI